MRSLANKTFTINDTIISNKLDLMFLTEAWFDDAGNTELIIIVLNNAPMQTEECGGII